MNSPSPEQHQAALDAAFLTLPMNNRSFRETVEKAIAAYLSALPAKAEGWQPIETAPGIGEAEGVRAVFFSDRLDVRHFLSFGGYDMGDGGSVVSKQRLRGALAYVDQIESELSAAREEIDRVGKYLFRAQVALHMCNSVFVLGNDDANARIADFLAELDENFSSDKAEEWASEALRSSRTKGETP